MDWSLFIIPLTLIVVELIKRSKIDKQKLPFVAVLIGGLLGVVFAVYYGVDLLEHIVSGIVYGAAAAGIYDVGESAVRTVKN